ncbi:MAG: hypothetical protein OXQ29_05790 [Rhodospirillaceae bacterium]|nr:hypothetical protein [Rhodospirillaceae bacterium]
MPDTAIYRGNKLEVKRSGRKKLLSINGENIASFTNDELKQGIATQYSYLPANDPIELGMLIVDQQLSLSKTKIADLKDA